jgi:hypothetical protein
MRGRALAGVGRETLARGLHSRVALLGALLCVCSGGWCAGAVSGQPNDDAVYGYIDDHGRMVHAQSLADIPPRLRPYARRLDVRDDGLVTLLETKLGTSSSPVIYRYVSPLGQTRYTNLLASVPLPQRSAAAVDLSRVSLNSEVGRDLDRVLEKEHERLVQSPTCQQLRAAAAKPLWRAIWDEHGPLVVMGALFCLLVLVTPTMLRRFGPNWAKALSVSVSVLAAAGLFTYAALRGTQALSQLQAKAAPCEPGTWNALAKHDRGIVDKVQLLQSMRVEQQGLEQIASEGR